MPPVQTQKLHPDPQIAHTCKHDNSDDGRSYLSHSGSPCCSGYTPTKQEYKDGVEYHVDHDARPDYKERFGGIALNEQKRCQHA